MNIFNKIVNEQHENDIRLGSPATSPEQFSRRLTFFSNLLGGKGFSQKPKPIKKDAQGKTRGQRHRELMQVRKELHANSV